MLHLAHRSPHFHVSECNSWSSTEFSLKFSYAIFLTARFIPVRLARHRNDCSKQIVTIGRARHLDLLTEHLLDITGTTSTNEKLSLGQSLLTIERKQSLKHSHILVYPIMMMTVVLPDTAYFKFFYHFSCLNPRRARIRLIVI